MGTGSQNSLGSILIKYHLISRAELDSALEEQRRAGGRLGKLLLKRGVVTEDALFWCLANQLNVPCVTSLKVESGELDPEAARLIPRALAFKHHVVGILQQGNQLVVATDDPLDTEGLGEVERAVRMSLQVSVAPPSELARALDAIYGSADDPRAEEPGGLLEQWLRDCLAEGVTRVRLEPTAEGAQVTFLHGARKEAPRPISAQLFMALTDELRGTMGGSPVVGAEIHPLNLPQLSGSVAFVRGRFGPIAVVSLEERRAGLEWPDVWCRPLREAIQGPGLWLVACAGREDTEEVLRQLRVLLDPADTLPNIRARANGPVSTDLREQRSMLEALLALQPPSLVLSGSMRAAVIETLREGVPSCPLVLAVPTASPGAALQTLRSSGMTGPELAASLRGVLCAFGVSSLLSGEPVEAREGLAHIGPPPRVGPMGDAPGGPAPLLLELYLCSSRMQRALVEEWGITSLAPLFARGPLPPVAHQLRAYGEDGRLSPAELAAVMEHGGPTRVAFPGGKLQAQ